MATPHRPPLSVRRALIKLGEDIYDARKKRKLTAKTVAERAFTSRVTLSKIEAGDYRVSIGIYASVLNALGMISHLADLADPSRDTVALRLTSPSALREPNRKTKRKATRVNPAKKTAGDT